MGSFITAEKLYYSQVDLKLKKIFYCWHRKMRLLTGQQCFVYTLQVTSEVLKQLKQIMKGIIFLREKWCIVKKIVESGIVDLILPLSMFRGDKSSGFMFLYLANK